MDRHAPNGPAPQPRGDPLDHPLDPAECAAISRLQAGHSRWTTGDYVKICAGRRDELDAWAHDTLGAERQDGCHCLQ